ncbi:hypothetical protein WA588_001896 [Blastocystis sp. NMH]
MLSHSFRFPSVAKMGVVVFRGVATRYSYNKTIPQTIYSKEDIVLSFRGEDASVSKKDIKRTARTKLGLSSGKALPSGHFFSRKQHFNEDQNVVEAELLSYDKPFVDLIRNDLWVLDPMCLREEQIPDSLNLLPCEKSVFDMVAPGSKCMRFMESTCRGVGNIVSITATMATDPAEAERRAHHALHALHSGVSNIWTSTKLYGREVHTGSRLFWKLIKGGQLSYRERKLLTRAVVDTSRLVPFTVFAVIPFSEFALPFVLKKFPNFLPSTFTSETTKAEIRHNLVEARIAMAREYYDTMKRSAAQHSREDRACDACADELLRSVRRVAHGQSGDPTELTRVLRLFRDGVVVDQLDKPQLAAMARFLGVLTLGVTLGGDELVRTAVRRRLRGLAREDRELFAEGVEGLTKAELAGICESRGMRCEGLKKAEYVAALDEWLRYSVELRIPAGMMVVSSMLALGGTRPLGEMFPSAVAMMNEEVVQEAIIAVAPVGDKTAMEMRYEREVEEEKVVREENIEREQFSINTDILLFSPNAVDAGAEKKKKKTAKRTKKQGRIELL